MSRCWPTTPSRDARLAVAAEGPPVCTSSNRSRPRACPEAARRILIINRSARATAISWRCSAGSDPALKDQVIVVSAHYDHVGYGTRRNSFGPIGLIHNGADDNASGVSLLMEVIDAFSRLGQAPKRSMLFAFWDGEEKGLLGSIHWVGQPTVPLDHVVLNINADMVGRSRGGKLEVSGSRTMPGLRRLFSTQNETTGLAIDFPWDIKTNSDHYTFYKKQIPALLIHTGLAQRLSPAERRRRQDQQRRHPADRPAFVPRRRRGRQRADAGGLSHPQPNRNAQQPARRRTGVGFASRPVGSALESRHAGRGGRGRRGGRAGQRGGSGRTGGG